MKKYPKYKYHPEKDTKLVLSAEDEAKLGAQWLDSPAEFGVETCPGLIPDPMIAAKKKAFDAAVHAPVEIARKPGRPKKVSALPEGDGAA